MKVSAAGSKSFVVQYRLAGGRAARTRRVTIGKFGSPWTVETARKEAQRLLGEVAHGEDPAERASRTSKALTVSELCDQYLRDGTGLKKASTLATDRGRIKRHIKPLLGTKRAASITKNDVVKFQNDIADGKTARDERTGPRGRSIVRGGKGTAARTVGLLGGIFSYACEAGLIDENPVSGVTRHKDKRNQRFLTQDDIAVIGTCLKSLENDGKSHAAISIVRLLLLTGARRGEIERLRWHEVDFHTRRLCLDDSKTGQKQIPLNDDALNILIEVGKSRATDAKGYVFPSEDGRGFYSGTPKFWSHVRRLSGFKELRLHDLRHSFASLGLLQGSSLAVLGALLGHKSYQTTQRYAHLTDDPLRNATENIGATIGDALGLRPPLTETAS